MLNRLAGVIFDNAVATMATTTSSFMLLCPLQRVMGYESEVAPLPRREKGS